MTDKDKLLFLNENKQFFLSVPKTLKNFLRYK